MIYTFIHSIKFAIFISILGLTFIGHVLITQAYFTSAQKEVTLGNGTGLFLIEYSFGMQKYDVYMPIIAQNSPIMTNETLSYKILNTDNTEASGKMSAIVLGEPDITPSGMYKIQKGKSQKMTLAVFFTPETKNTSEYRLQVTNLPFNWNGAQQLKLNPSELKYYTTKLLSL